MTEFLMVGSGNNVRGIRQNWLTDITTHRNMREFPEIKQTPSVVQGS